MPLVAFNLALSLLEIQKCGKMPINEIQIVFPKFQTNVVASQCPSCLAAPMTGDRVSHGWSGTIRKFLDTPQSLVEDALQHHISGLFGKGASGSQKNAWEEEIEILRNAFRNLSIARQDCLNWSVVFEYELPLEGGRRPDVIILGPGQLLVLEFKQDPTLHRAAIDQVAAYARDLAEYHSKTHGLPVIPYLIPTKTSDLSTIKDNVAVLSPDQIAPHLDNLPDAHAVDLNNWIQGDYAPLPTLIAAAKMIFNHERLPTIKRAESLGVKDAVDALKEIAVESKKSNSRSLAFVSGVPGAGKTLVGLQFVYEGVSEYDSAIFLSGNGPLVEVLRDALKSKAFVRDLHSFIKSYGLTSKLPPQHIIVFDEAQRAWDAEHMNNKNAVPISEPELLIGIGEKLPDWATLVGLIGHGQEINSGEEAGISGWAQALLSPVAKSSWKIFIPPRFGHEFIGQSVKEIPALDLTKSLRSRQAENLHEWVEKLLSGQLGAAARIANQMLSQTYPILITRDLDAARRYLREVFDGQPNKRYGILASAKDNVLPDFGILNGFQDTKRIKYANWYNRDSGEQGSGCNLEDVVTEFGCQGLELDMALVAWGNDYLWNGSTWEMRKMRSKYPQKDPHQLRKNSYRVLLTRSRDGVVIFVPESEKFDKTEQALLAAGARILMDPIPLALIG